jgi:hypothetical protein
VQSLQYCIALSDSAVARADAEDEAELADAVSARFSGSAIDDGVDNELDVVDTVKLVAVATGRRTRG